MSRCAHINRMISDRQVSILARPVTIPLRTSPSTEINTSFKVMISLQDDGVDPRLAANLGVGIGPDNLSLVFRPEVGIMSYIESPDDPFIHFGIGISLANTYKKRSDQYNQINE